MNREHQIDIVESDAGVTAYITNLKNGLMLTISLDRRDFPSRDEMIGELFAGSVPNIRDCYDSDTWVNEPVIPREQRHGTNPRSPDATN